MKCPTCLNRKMSPARIELTPAQGTARVIDAMFCSACGTAVPIDKKKRDPKK